MDFFSKNRFAGILIFFLVIVNLLLLFTLWHQKLSLSQKEKKGPVEYQVKNKKPASIGSYRKEREEQLIQFLRKEMDFSNDQVMRFQKLRQEHFQKIDQMRYQVDELRGQLMDLILEEILDKEKVEELSNQISQKVVQQETEVFYHFKALMSICNQEQLEKYKFLIRDIIHQMAPKQHPGDHQPPLRRHDSPGGYLPPPNRHDSLEGHPPPPIDHGSQLVHQPPPLLHRNHQSRNDDPLRQGKKPPHKKKDN